MLHTKLVLIFVIIISNFINNHLRKSNKSKHKYIMFILCPIVISAHMQDGQRTEGCISSHNSSECVNLKLFNTAICRGYVVLHALWQNWERYIRT